MDDLDQVILIQFSQLIRDAGTFTTALVTDELTQEEQDHFAKRFALLAETVKERAERTGRRARKASGDDSGSAGGDTDPRPT
jgi:hypothetical protein